MERIERGSRGTMGRASASSFSASGENLERAVRRIGLVLAKVHEMAMSAAVAADAAGAEELNDELKPLVDALIHFEVPRAKDA